MIVDNFDVPSLAFAPYEAHPLLLIDADAVLAFAITAQCFQSVTGRHSQIVELLRRIDREKSYPSAPLDLRR